MLWIFVLLKIWVKNLSTDISKYVSGKYSQKLLDHARKSAADALKDASNRVIQKAVEATGDLIGNKIADRITKVSKKLQQCHSKTVTDEHDKGIPKEKYISPEKRQTSIDDLRLI